MKEVDIQNVWTFQLGTQEGMNVPLWITVGFQQRDRQDSQNLNNDTFYRPPVTSGQCNIGTEKYPDSGILLNFDDDDQLQGYIQIKETFRDLTEDNILKPYISDNDFRSSNNHNDFGHNLYVFDTRCHKNLEIAQPVKVKIIFSENIPAGFFGYTSVLSNKLDF